MNKIIFFVLLIVIGSAFSTMMEAPKPKYIKNEDFDCTMRAIKHCGSDNSRRTNRCLTDYVRRCQGLPETNNISETTTTHKKHHTYKTSVVLKENEDVQKICITDSKCNCKSQAKVSCDKNDEECLSSFIADCKSRCRKTRKCYAIDCSNAGNKCEAGDECCVRYEKATCRRALRVYKFRQVCDEQAQTSCSSITEEKEKCACVGTSRHQCLVKKVDQHRRSIRKFFGCDAGARIICQEKKCGFEYKQCVKRESSTCQPLCVSECQAKCHGQSNGPCYSDAYKVCINNYKKNYCVKRAHIKCGKDQECLNTRLAKCTESLPPCMTGEVNCNDNNKCTKDICDPKVGCVNVAKTCDDNNACTQDSCDPAVGCVYKATKCNDGKLCTRDTCNSQTGLCKYTFDDKICHTCSTGPCNVDSDCAAFASAKNLAEKCQKAVCNQQTGSCQVVNKKKCATKCRKSCIPNDACDDAKCILNDTLGIYQCVHSKKTCNDFKSCTIDSCDAQLGCQHQVDAEKCPANPICNEDSDCTAWGKKRSLETQCLKAYCHLKKGICLTKVTSKQCELETCQRNCQPNNACETTKCVETSNGNAFCQRTPIICNDNKDCTVDSCDSKLGCVFKYRVNEVCKVGCQCSHNADCSHYAVAQNLEERCMKAVCDQKLGACVAVAKSEKCKRKIKDCKVDCQPSHACEVARCIKDETGELTCERTTKKCDDRKECTVDTCDKNLGCVHTYTPSENCPADGECKCDCGCIRFGFARKLGKQCLKATCDKKLGACIVKPKSKPCRTITKCQETCVADSPCETPSCEINEDGNYFCKRVTTNCDDGKRCTLDTCDVNSGKCRNTPIANCEEKCELTDAKCIEKEKCRRSCTPRSLCEDAVCKYNKVTGTATCSYKAKSCDDGKKCTVDSCEKSVGCVNKYVVSEECPRDSECKNTFDCDKWSVTHKCSERCLTVKCDQEFGKCVSHKTNDPTCIPKSDCVECAPRNKCETAKCIKVNGKAVCERTTTSCDDGKECTKDSCDVATGKCVNTYVPSEKCLPDADCKKNIDCEAWGKKNKIGNCQEAICDKSGSCKAIKNGFDCSEEHCQTKCPKRNQCERARCKYDSNNQLVCQYKKRSCDDGNKCTVDTCDNQKGCVHTFDATLPGCDDNKNPRCEKQADCAQWAQKLKLADNCQEAYCSKKTGTCRRIKMRNPTCLPPICKTCVPTTKCETAQCIVDVESNSQECIREDIKCNDENPCTVDSCHPVKGCQFVYKKDSDKCTSFCQKDNDCLQYSLDNECSLKCEVAYCDAKTTSCAVKPDPNPSCKPIKPDCDLICKRKDKCHSAKCVRKTEKGKTNQFTCVQEPITCYDGVECTKDSCDPVKGCQFVFTKSAFCESPCDKDLDCKQWGVDKKLEDKCFKPKCSVKRGTCIAIQGPKTEKCKSEPQCQVSNDCPASKFGTVCCEQAGVKQCLAHLCEEDRDCKPKDKKTWGYCSASAGCGRKQCEYKPICTKNSDCNDGNSCTEDKCLRDYGYCRHTPRCVDNSACTHDICIPGTDGKSYTCKNPVKCCTQDKNLIDKNYQLLSKKEQKDWLGVCSHIKGCETCVVNAQCDDHNGCTRDSCEQQFCVSTPIDNKWCDPKLEGQKITVQAYFPKFVRL